VGLSLAAAAGTVVPFSRLLAQTQPVGDIQAIGLAGAKTFVSSSDLQQLKNNLRGALLLPGNAGYDEARRVRNESIDTELAADVSYNKPAIDKLVKRVRKSLERKPVEAKVDLSKGFIDEHRSKTGLRVKYNTLAKEVEQTLLDPGNTDEVKIRTTVVQPKVSTADLAKKYPAVLIVDRGSFKLTLYKNLKKAKTYGIAVGQVGLDTPAGLYTIQNKAINPAWHVPNSDWAGDLAGKVIPGDDPSNPIKARWMGIYDGVGVHGTSDDASIGSNASHGCIRMHVPDVIDLFKRVPVGTPVLIQ